MEIISKWNGSEESFRVWRDSKTRSAADQMAIDEGLLRDTDVPILRFYQWASPAITIGYFVSEAPVSKAYPGLEIARRRTGGGIVEHGDDVTFALAVPRTAAAGDPRFASLLKAPAPARYRWIHERLAAALQSCGVEAAVVEAGDLETGNDDPGRCFSGPVVSDLVDPRSGRKIAGGAQRRSREGWIHQGSVRLDPPHNRIDAQWTRAFYEKLRDLEGLSEGLLP